jgi:MORN repeat protein
VALSGTYTWANGSFYKGQWSKGLKNGSGEMVFNASSGVSNFSMLYSSGNEYVSGATHGIQDVKFPLELKITYMVWNKIHTSQNSMLFEFVINDPGNWEITMRN